MVREDFKSDEEFYVYCFLNELKKHGYVKEFSYQGKTWILTDKVKREFDHGIIQSVQKSSYTCDFTIEWHENIMPEHIHSVDNISYIDVKGTFSRNNSDHTFPYCHKFVYEKFGCHVQKIIPFSTKKKSKRKGETVIVNKPGLLESTFTPDELMFKKHKKTGKILNPRWNYRNIKKYLDDRKRT